MAQGLQTTYVQTVPQKRMVTDRILFADPYDIPLLNAFGMDAESKFKFVNTPGKMYEWLEDGYSPVSDVVASGLASSSTTTTFTATDGSVYHVGDIVLIDSEYMYVSSISTNVVTVVRAHGGTQATHADSSVAYIVSQARLEGANASDSHFTAPTSGYNYSFILEKSVKISGSDARLARYGIANLVEYEIDKKMDELMIQLTKKPYYGVRAAGSTTTSRDAGGFDTFITTNLTNCSSAALTLDNIEDMAETLYNAGSKANLIVCGGFAKRKLTSFYEGAVVRQPSDRLGGIVIDQIQTAIGQKFDILVDRYCPSTSMYFLDPEKIGFVAVRPFEYKDLGAIGDLEGYGEIVGEYGFVVANQTHHGKIYGFSTSA